MSTHHRFCMGFDLLKAALLACCMFIVNGHAMAYEEEASEKSFSINPSFFYWNSDFSDVFTTEKGETVTQVTNEESKAVAFTGLNVNFRVFNKFYAGLSLIAIDQKVSTSESVTSSTVPNVTRSDLKVMQGGLSLAYHLPSFVSVGMVYYPYIQSTTEYFETSTSRNFALKFDELGGTGYALNISYPLQIGEILDVAGTEGIDTGLSMGPQFLFIRRTFTARSYETIQEGGEPAKLVIKGKFSSTDVFPMISLWYGF